MGHGRAVLPPRVSAFGAESPVTPYCWREAEPAESTCLRAFDIEQRTYSVVAGRLIPENNSDSIAAADLRRELSHPLNDACGDEATVRARTRVSLQAVAVAYKALLRSAARGNRRSAAAMPTQWDAPE